MKKVTLFLSIILSLILNSCDDFLEPKSQDKIVPKNIDQLSEFLLGEVIKSDKDPISYLAFMTDDIEDYLPTGKINYEQRSPLWGYYTWQANPEISKSGDITEDKAWDTYYHQIFICNVILNEIPDVTGDQIKKDMLKAETYFMRANAYFYLVNLYGEPYRKENADKLLGVPINNESTILDKRYKRSSVLKVYNQIEDDLTKAIKIFEELDYDINIARPNINAANLLMSRVAIFKEEWKKAKDYADKVIETGTPLANLNKDNLKYFIIYNNPEILFCYGFSKISGTEITSIKSAASYKVSQDYYKQYDEEDLRPDLFIRFGSKSPYKFHSMNSNCYGKTFRMSEAYLNRAEALCHLDKFTDAMKDVKEVLDNRMTEEQQIEATTKSEALKIVRKERRREFCFEYFRWFDLRRYNDVTLVHNFTTTGGKIKYELKPNDHNFTLPIPMSVKKMNPEIEDIKREEKTQNN
jgi:hypothetical protein